MATATSTISVRANQVDTLDALLYRHLGTTAGGVVEAALQLNPGLAALGPVLPVGTLVTLPPINTSATTAQSINLWD